MFDVTLEANVANVVSCLPERNNFCPKQHQMRLMQPHAWQVMNSAMSQPWPAGGKLEEEQERHLVLRKQHKGQWTACVEEEGENVKFVCAEWHDD